MAPSVHAAILTTNLISREVFRLVLRGCLCLCFQGFLDPAELEMLCAALGVV